MIPPPIVSGATSVAALNNMRGRDARMRRRAGAKLTIVLNIKKVLRKALLWEHWPRETRRSIKDFRARILIAVYSRLGRIHIEQRQGRLELTCGRRRVIADDTCRENKEELLSLVSNFHALFETPALDEPGDTIDLTREIRILGFNVLTSFGSVIEADGMKDYNRYYPLKEGDVVFDCGGHHGLYALLASRCVGSSGKVFCFEPDEGNAAVLQRNLDANRASNVELVRKGIWKSEGSVPFSPGHGTTSFIPASGLRSPTSPPSSIEVVSIPGFFRERQLDRLDFVKMDIEGVELEAVQGCLDFLADHAVNFGIASYHLRGGEETFHRLETLFASAAYRVVTEVTHTITTYAWIRTNENL